MDRNRPPGRPILTAQQIQSGTVPSGYTQAIVTSAPSAIFSPLTQDVQRLRPAIGQGVRLPARQAIRVDTRSRLRYDLTHETVTGRERQIGESEYQGRVLQHYPEYKLFPEPSSSQGYAASARVPVGGSIISDLCERLHTSWTLPDSEPSKISFLSEKEHSGRVEREGAGVYVPFPSSVSDITDEKVAECGAVGLSGLEMLGHMQAARPIYTVAQGANDNVRVSSASFQQLKPLSQSHADLSVESEENIISGVITVEELERRLLSEATVSEGERSCSSQSAQPVSTGIKAFVDHVGSQEVPSSIQASRPSHSPRVPLSHYAGAQRLPLLPEPLLPRFRPDRYSSCGVQRPPLLPEPLLPRFRPDRYSSFGVQRPLLLPEPLLPRFRARRAASISRPGMRSHRPLLVSNVPVPARTTAPTDVFPNDPARQSVLNQINSLQGKRVRANVLRWTPQGGIACYVKTDTRFSLKFLFRFPPAHSQNFLPVYNNLAVLSRDYKCILVTIYFRQDEAEAYVQEEEPENFEDAGLQSNSSIPIYGKDIFPLLATK